VRADDTAAHRLRTTMAATRVSFTWFGVRKTLSEAQKAQAADQFDAEAKYLSASKKLLDTQDAAYKAVTTVRGKVVQFWRSLTLPYPEPGMRLIRQGDVGMFDSRMDGYREELRQAVADLDDHYNELRQSARQRLGDLYDARDYPIGLTDEFAVAWEFPSVEPPSYLQQLNPRVYAQECERVEARFNEAIQLAEQAFFEELSKLVGHLTERLSGAEDGKPKVFRDSALENFGEFFDRFRRLNVRSNDQLDELVAQARRVISGVEPQQLRDNSTLRQQVTSQMAAVQATLDGLMVDRPRRSILRPPRTEAP
jgi:hypothetical protein